MSTQTDPPCSAADKAAIIRQAKMHINYIKWLSAMIGSAHWQQMLPTDQDLIRAEVRLVLEQMTEGCS
jgi:hypothetical protein